MYRDAGREQHVVIKNEDRRDKVKIGAMISIVCSETKREEIVARPVDGCTWRIPYVLIEGERKAVYVSFEISAAVSASLLFVTRLGFNSSTLTL